MIQTVSDIMTTHVHCCTPLDNVDDVALKMRELNVGAIPIIENDLLVGMITDRDLVIRGITEKHLTSNLITTIMSGNIITAHSNTSIEEAAKIMAEHQIRRLPIVDNGKLKGIVALGDLSINKKSTKEELALTQISPNKGEGNQASY